MQRAAVVTTVLSLVVGCGTDREIACRAGFALAQDGHCYPPPPDPRPPTANDVLANLGACEPKKDGDEIDIPRGCIEEACVDATWDVVQQTLGEGVACEAVGADWICEWPQFISIQFPIGDDDVVTPAAGARAGWVRALSTYVGADGDGLAIGISLQCFVDVLGMPTTAEFVDTAGELVARQLVWELYGIEVEDEQHLDGVDLPDGVVDEITLSGPP
jgi:hypothetical protein